jgi:magnesium chelatase family protein
MLVGAMNPCPCGFLGDDRRECRCTPPQIARYRDRLSGPLRDRLDLTVDVPAVPPDLLGATGVGESSAAIRRRVIDARARQGARSADTAVASNATLTPALMRTYCALDRAGVRVLDAAVRTLALSARAYDRVRKVARTIADLDGATAIAADHVAEALQYRMLS